MLSEYIVSAQEKYKLVGYKPGEFDCAVFASGWAKKLTGVDYYADYRGKYSTDDEARALIAQQGGFKAALTAKLGEPIHPAMAQRGDIAFRESDEACGIYFTSGARMLAIFLSSGGFVLHRISETSHAFRL